LGLRAAAIAPQTGRNSSLVRAIEGKRMLQRNIHMMKRDCIAAIIFGTAKMPPRNA
jgi:hypothetical protein